MPERLAAIRQRMEHLNADLAMEDGGLIGRRMVAAAKLDLAYLLARLAKAEAVARAAQARFEVWNQETYKALKDALATWQQTQWEKA